MRDSWTLGGPCVRDSWTLGVGGGLGGWGGAWEVGRRVVGADVGLQRQLHPARMHGWTSSVQYAWRKILLLLLLLLLQQRCCVSECAPARGPGRTRPSHYHQHKLITSCYKGSCDRVWGCLCRCR